MSAVNSTLDARARECVLRYERMLLQKPGVAKHLKELEATVTTSTREMWQRRSRPSDRRPSLAVLIRGQTYRGHMRETFHIDGDTHSRAEAQRRCTRSLMERLVLPYERRGHRVDVFFTVYRELGGSLAALLAPFGARVAAVTTVEQRTTATQLLPLGAAVRAFLSWCAAHGESYTAVVVTRFDLLLKTSLRDLMGDASAIDGFRLLWREASDILASIPRLDPSSSRC